jgi:hypothetical protein
LPLKISSSFLQQLEAKQEFHRREKTTVTRSNGERRHKAGKGGLGQNNPRERGE